MLGKQQKKTFILNWRHPQDKRCFEQHRQEACGVISTNYNLPIFYILTYTQQDATLHSLFYLETALHVSGGTITHHQERKQMYLQHLVFVTPLLLSAAIVEELELV